MSKYKPLGERLRGHPGDEWKASFSEIEEVLGFPLPKTARSGRSWWTNEGEKPHAKSWTGEGWQADVEPGLEAVTFRRGGISPAALEAAGLAPVGDLGDIELDMPPPPKAPYAASATNHGTPALQAGPIGEPKPAAEKKSLKVPKGLGIGAAIAGTVAVVAGLTYMLFRPRR